MTDSCIAATQLGRVDRGPGDLAETEEERERAHWLIERDLRERLLASAPEERERVTAEVYDALFQRVPWHPANQSANEDPEIEGELWRRVFGDLCPPGGTIADLGCGLGSVVIGMASRTKEAVGEDTSQEEARSSSSPLRRLPDRGTARRDSATRQPVSTPRK